jgi:hypothetical protein
MVSERSLLRKKRGEETKKTSAEVFDGEVGLSSRSSARSRIALGATRWRTV